MFLAYLPFIALVVALLVATVLAYRVLRDLRGESDETLTEAEDLIGPIEEAYAAGHMSEEEYLRARGAVARSGFPGRFDDLPGRSKLAGGPTPARDLPADAPAIAPEPEPGVEERSEG